MPACSSLFAIRAMQGRWSLGIIMKIALASARELAAAPEAAK
jgi:hypothetical protein